VRETSLRHIENIELAGHASVQTDKVFPKIQRCNAASYQSERFHETFAVP